MFIRTTSGVLLYGINLIKLSFKFPLKGKNTRTQAHITIPLLTIPDIVIWTLKEVGVIETEVEGLKCSQSNKTFI